MAADIEAPAPQSAVPQNTAPQNTGPKKKRTLLDVLRALRRPKMAVMLALGFSSGLPFMLFGNTLGFWLAEGDVKLATIGFLTAVITALGLATVQAYVPNHLSGRVFGVYMVCMGLMPLGSLPTGALATSIGTAVSTPCPISE